VEYKLPQGRTSCAIFIKFAESVPHFRIRLSVKISLDLLKGLQSYGGFKLMVSHFCQIFSTPQRQNCASDPQKFCRCKNVLEVLYHHAKFGGARISPAAGTAKNVEFFVRLSVRHASVNAALSVHARWRRLFYVNCSIYVH